MSVRLVRSVDVLFCVCYVFMVMHSFPLIFIAPHLKLRKRQRDTMVADDEVVKPPKEEEEVAENGGEDDADEEDGVAAAATGDAPKKKKKKKSKWMASHHILCQKNWQCIISYVCAH